MNKSNTVYINNLPNGTTETQIRDKFSEYGTITAIRMPTLTKRGFAFFDFSTEEEAQHAIDAVNGKEFLGNTIKVEKTRHKYGDNPHLKRQSQQCQPQMPQNHNKCCYGRYDHNGAPNIMMMNQRYQRHPEQPYGYRMRDDMQMNMNYHQFNNLNNGMCDMSHMNYYINDYYPQFKRIGNFQNEYIMNQNEIPYAQRDMMPVKRFKDDD